jgi:hypothetical protein
MPAEMVIWPVRINNSENPGYHTGRSLMGKSYHIYVMRVCRCEHGHAGMIICSMHEYIMSHSGGKAVGHRRVHFRSWIRNVCVPVPKIMV